MMKFLEVTFPVGQAVGFQTVEHTIYFSEVTGIVNSYNQWLQMSVLLEDSDGDSGNLKLDGESTFSSVQQRIGRLLFIGLK